MKFRNFAENFSIKQNSIRKGFILAMLALATLSIHPSAIHAQTKKPHRKASTANAAKPVKIECGGGVELRVSASTPAQGTLLIAEVRSPDTLSGIAGRFTDRDISFGRQPVPASQKV